MLSEISQTERDKYYMISIISQKNRISNKIVQMNLQNRNRFADI